MSELNKCPRCGARLPHDSPGGHCISCLLQLGLTADPLVEPVHTQPGTIQINPPTQTRTEKPGDRIGRYKLLQQIGEGGCGVVYMAEQAEPMRRRVALKVIKLGMDTKQVIARFEAERQALALMDHPNIAKVLYAGATDSGRPYFVMELVRGIKITDYCDQQKLSTRQRLELFVQVCQAVQHAHQKGIIHRDLKPSNILVTEQDGKAVPKIIDFGIAKATTSAPLTDKTLFTAFDQFIGTPAYMSPEQAGLGGLDIDTRSDVYSLGVLLYELLTGRQPFDSAALRRSAIDEILRIIREQEPPRPSASLTTLTEQELTLVAQRHQSEPTKFSNLLRGDLDWIVMKALEKDRTRRYLTANDFSTDIKRHLMNETVSAGAPTAGYKFAKFVRRNKNALSIGLMVASLTIALLVCVFFLFKDFKAENYGGITVNSDPNGAEVWRDGQLLGTTPFKSVKLRTGEFAYSLVLSNYESVTNKTRLLPKTLQNDLVFLRRVELSGAGTILNSSTNITKLTGIASRGVIIVSTQGTVEVARSGTVQWIPAEANTAVSPGDKLRTAMGSSVALLWSDNSVVRISELTTIEIADPSLEFKNGTIYESNANGTTNHIRIITSGSLAGVKG